MKSKLVLQKILLCFLFLNFVFIWNKFNLCHCLHDISFAPTLVDMVDLVSWRGVRVNFFICFGLFSSPPSCSPSPNPYTTFPSGEYGSIAFWRLLLAPFLFSSLSFTSPNLPGPKSFPAPNTSFYTLLFSLSQSTHRDWWLNPGVLFSLVLGHSPLGDGGGPSLIMYAGAEMGAGTTAWTWLKL